MFHSSMKKKRDNQSALNELTEEREKNTNYRKRREKMQIILKVLFIFISNFLCSKKMNGIPFRITTTGAVI